MDKTQRSSVVVKHRPMVEAIASRLKEQLPISVEKDDLLQAGMIGLLSAQRRYRKSSGQTFGTFAKHRVKGAMLDFLRTDDWMGRDARKRRTRIERMRERLVSQLCRIPTEEEVAHATGMTVEKYREFMSGPSSLLSLTPPDSEAQPIAFADGRALSPEQYAERTMISTRLWSLVTRVCNQREQDILRMYYIEGVSWIAIAGHYGITQGRISQIQSAAMQKLRKHIEPAHYGRARSAAA